MKVKNTGYDSWEIYEGEKVVGTIETFHGFKNNTKTLYVKDKQICNVKNQKEAIEKLQGFFEDNKREIKSIETMIEQLSIGIEQVEHKVCIDSLEKTKAELILKLVRLKSYDLI